MSNILSAFILEDEPLARDRMRVLLEKCEIKVVGEAADAAEAFSLLAKLSVDVIFVDVGLPGMSGISFARNLLGRANSPHIIFTTACENYAVDAFEIGAVDYLLKPVRLERLQHALKRIIKNDKLSNFSHFTVRGRDQIKLIPLSEARYLKAEDKYVVLVTADKHEYLLDDTLVKIEESLGDNLVRIHRGFLVLIHAIKSLERSQQNSCGWVIRLKDTDELLPVSRRQLPALRMLLENPKQ